MQFFFNQEEMIIKYSWMERFNILLRGKLTLDKKNKKKLANNFAGLAVSIMTTIDEKNEVMGLSSLPGEVIDTK